MAEVQWIDQGRILDFVREYLRIIETNVIEISHKRNTLKARVKQLSLEFKIPKDFANYISLFLIVTKFIYVENKIWRVNDSLTEKLDRPGLLLKNLFRFLFFTRDYNEYYKSPLVFNTIFANNDYEVIRKRKSVVQTLIDLHHESRLSFDQIYQILTRRYAFFREYNNPSNYYYTKGDVYSNKHFIFLFIFKTLTYLGVVSLEKKGKLLADYYFSLTDQGKQLIEDLFSAETLRKPSQSHDKQVIMPYKIMVKEPTFSNTSFPMLFNQVLPPAVVDQLSSKKNLNSFVLPMNQNAGDFNQHVRNQIVRRLQEENVPNLLV